MIVDCHTQVWDSPDQLGRAAFHRAEQAVRADTARHLEAIEPVDRAIVLAFKSRYLDAEISNKYVSDYVRRYPQKMVGFAGVDPTEHDWREELRVAQEELGLKGAVVAPALQDFHPADTHAMRLYEECMRRGMPILFEQSHRNPAAKMEFARPLLVDEVAREFPELRIIVAHLGYPWVDETIVLLSKHQQVYADVSGLLRRPWMTYNALLGAYECGAIDKLLFGSDFPYRSPAACIEALYSINQMVHGTNLESIPREQLRGIVERDALSLLGIEESPAPANKNKAPILSYDE